MPRAAVLTCVAQAGRTPAAPVAAQRALCAVDGSPRVDYSPPWGMASPCTQHWNQTVGCHPHHPTCPATAHFTQVAQVTQRTDSRTEAEVLNRPPGRAQVRVTRPGTRPACRCDGDGRGFYRCPGPTSPGLRPHWGLWLSHSGLSHLAAGAEGQRRSLAQEKVVSRATRPRKEATYICFWGPVTVPTAERWSLKGCPGHHQLCRTRPVRP